MSINLRDTLPSISVPPSRVWWNKDGNDAPIRYQVMVMKAKGNSWEHMIGTIVTHLAVEDYCQLHGYRLVELYHGTRHALEQERTELF